MSEVRVSGERIPVPLFVAGLLVIVLGVAGMSVLAANPGSGEAEVDDVRAQFRRFVELVADGDGDGACAVMTPQAGAAFAERAVGDPDVEPVSCAETVEALASARSADASTRLRGVEIVDARVVGVGDEGLEEPNRAEVDIDDGTVVLGRDGGCAGSPECWQITDGRPVTGLAAPEDGGG